MKQAEFNIGSVTVAKVAVLVSFVAMTFSALASNLIASCQVNDSTGKVEIFADPEQQPYFPGGETALLKYLQENIKYPPKAIKDSIQGRVVVQFLIDPAGCVGEVKVLRSVREDLDAEAVRVVKTLPKFVPGRMYGKAISAWYTLPVTYKIGAPDEPKTEEPKPEFPGGIEASKKYIAENLIYPEEAKRQGICGRVLVVTGIDRDGTVKVWALRSQSILFLTRRQSV